MRGSTRTLTAGFCWPKIPTCLDTVDLADALRQHVLGEVIDFRQWQGVRGERQAPVIGGSAGLTLR